MDTHKPHQQPEQDDLQAASNSTADYSQFMPPVGKQSRRHGRGTKIVILVVVILCIAGAGGYVLMKHHKKPAPVATTHSTTTKPPAAVTTTKQYNSAQLGVTFSYPSNWTVTEDDTSNVITVQSPAMSLTSATGSKVTGEVSMTINQQTPSLPMFTAGNAVAVLASQKINYTNPSSSQRAQTYVSFLQYEATTTEGALDGVYITGDSGYQKQQAIPEVDIANVAPLVRVTFAQCSNAKCTGNTSALSIASTSWNTTTFSQPILAMLESLDFN
jgi:uncharacterized protein (UPF0333 family)